MSRFRPVAPALGWVLLTVLGQAAALSLIVAGHGVGYQHYRPWSELSAQPIAVAVLSAQALLVAWGLRGALGPLLAGARRVLPGWRLGALLLAMVASSAIVGRDLARYGGELLLSSLVQLLALGTVVLAVRAIPPGALEVLRTRFDRLLGDDTAPGDDVRPQLDRFTLWLGAAVTVVCALLAVLVYGGHPHVPDEVAYLFQARTFATGRITLPNPEVPRAFEVYLVVAGRHGWFSPVPPGWPLVLALGALVRLAWLVNPLLTGLNVVLACLVLQPLAGRRTARLAALLLACSPWHLFLGMSFMPHAITLTCTLLATLGVMAARRTGQHRWAWLGGLALGVIASVRRLDAMIAALALGLWAIGLGGRRLRLAGTAGLVLGSMVSTVPLLLYNRHFTGKPGTFPMMVYTDSLFGKGTNDYGFGANRGTGWALDPNPGHDPVDGLINASLNTGATQVELFGWSIGSLLLVYALVLAGGLRRDDRLMLGAMALTFGFYFLNYFAGGPDFGARYWFLMIVPLAALAARAALTLGPRAGAADATPLLAGLLVLTVSAGATFMPWRSANKYYHYRGMRPDIATLARQAAFDRGLVFVRGREVPDYASAFVYNPLDLGAAQPVYVWHRDASTDSATVAAFPDRLVWVVDGPAASGDGYVVRAGPVAGAEALRLLGATAAP